MREDTPSLTAIFVAFARALATRDSELARACVDPFAEVLLPTLLRPLLELASRQPALRATLRRSSVGLIDHLALRTALIDGAVDHAVGRAMGTANERGEGGIRQVVLLGAGLDSRAHRMTSLANATVFELDHPATQAIKRRKASRLPRAARELRYAPCDFQQTHLTDALASVGFDATQRSLWIWEGVTMYLPEHAVIDTLGTIARHSAVDSVLVATYLTPSIVVGGQRLGQWSSWMLGAIAEPIRFAREPDELAELLTQAGFEVLSDALPVDAAPHFGIDVKRPTSLMPKEHIAVSIRTTSRGADPTNKGQAIKP